MNTSDLLIEIGCEELPADAQRLLAEQLLARILALLTEHAVFFGKGRCFSTPRRLAVLIEQVAHQPEKKTIKKLGPSVQHAYDPAGVPTLACLGFAKSCGASVDQLLREATPKGERVYCLVDTAAEPTHELLSSLLPGVIEGLSVPKKTMRWHQDIPSFLRPVRWLVALFQEATLPLSAFGLHSDNKTYGHRFYHPGAMTLSRPADYERLLAERGHVVACHQVRATQIKAALTQQAGPKQRVMMPPALLDEVVGLVEWPVVLRARFDAAFLALPKEVLVVSMMSHLKCFPLCTQAQQLTADFLVVSNMNDTSTQRIQAGNERVIHARLSDAQFFYHADAQRALSTRQADLKAVVFEKALGSVFDKTQRMVALSDYLATELKHKKTTVNKAAAIAKCDLTTAMVNEFPSLQGVMGYYYARAEGESEAVAQAIKSHYLPAFSKDRLPEDEAGYVLALADRMDTLCGIFSIGKQGTGEKDPYGLRRAALGIIRIILEKKCALSLAEWVAYSFDLYGLAADQSDGLADQVMHFFQQRLKAWYLDQGVPALLFEAVAIHAIDSLLAFDSRVQAVLAFQTLPESATLCAVNKRVANLLKKNAADSAGVIDPALFEEAAEKALFKRVQTLEKKQTSLCRKQAYQSALQSLTVLKAPMDKFFETVLVLCDDPVQRNNRLALLQRIHQLCTQVADIAMLS